MVGKHHTCFFEKIKASKLALHDVEIYMQIMEIGKQFM